MLTGRAPFAGATSGDVLVSILEREPPPLAEAAPQAPAALQAILNRALAKNCDARYQQANDLLHDLKELKQELELAARIKRSGDAPAALNLRAAASVEDVTARTTQADQPRLTGKQKRLARPIKWLAVALAIIVSGLGGVALYRHWWLPVVVNDKTIKSIAVLPFVNASADPAMEYLPDGITENLMQRLQQLPGLRVMARGTVFTYKGREFDPREIGQALQVRAVVTGRVQRQGDRLLITVELADARDGTQLWSERYQRPLTELLAVQAELAGALSTRLRPQISAQQKQQLGKDYTGNAEAYRLYLLGRYHFNQYSQEAGLKALEYYQQAIALDPTYALAYTGVADIYTDFSSRYLSPSEAMPKARSAALKALKLDNTLAEAHHSLALIKIWGDWDWAGAEQEFKQALALNPNLAVTHTIYGNTLSYQRRFDEARREIRLAQQLDPLSTLATEMMGWTFYFERRYDEAIAECRKLRELDATYYRATLHLAEIYRQKGQFNEAIAEVQKELMRQRTDAALGLLAYLYAANGQPKEARKLLAELEQIARQRWVSPVTLAKIHIGLNEPERALTRLREAYDAHSEFLFALSVDPIFDPLRNDPRFIELSRGVGLTP